MTIERATRRLGALALAALSAAPMTRAASPAPVEASKFMVVTAQHLASEIGAAVMRDGGNAVDAAVAVGYALAVVYPEAGNIGGGGFMTIRLANGRTTFLDFREKAPLAATATMFQDAKGNVVPGLSSHSWLSVGVPGSPAGLEYARVHYGTQPREKLMAPAIALARDGFTLEQGDVDHLAYATAGLRENPEAAAIFLRNGNTPKAGDRLVQADLAHSLGLISQQGPQAAFYDGPIGEAIAAASKKGGGILTKQDFARYKVREMPPIACAYRGYQVISSPPPSSGGVILCEMLGILQGYDLKTMGFHSAAEIHVLAEAMRRAYVDRNNRLGDPDFWHNPVAELTDPAYETSIRAKIDPERATPSSTMGPKIEAHEGTNTTQYSIADAAGNAVSVTYTLNEWFGAQIVAGRTGIVMNDEMDDFTSKPGIPNMYGLIEGANNAVAPGKTPLSSMTPTILTRDGKLAMVIGSPGGSRIITITLEAILNVIDHGMDIQEAIDAPRIHEQWQPEPVQVENFALSPDTQAILQQRGYSFRPFRHWGVAEGILVENGKLYGAHDSRGGSGKAVGGS